MVNSKMERSGCGLLQCTIPVFVKRDREKPWKVSIWMFDSCSKFETSTFFNEPSSSGKGER
jgi:hypothetical protein